MKKFLIAGGNSTLLVWNCAADKRPEIAKQHLGDVEQVGFITSENGLPKLTMMGNELCINATLSLAFYESGSGQLWTGGHHNPVSYVNKSDTIIQLDLHYKQQENIILFDAIGYLCTDQKIDVTKDMVADLAARYSLPAFGIIVYEDNKIKPSVYVSDTDSLVHETACGSGSIATSIFTGHEKIVQPSGGIITVNRNAEFFTVEAKVTVLS